MKLRRKLLSAGFALGATALTLTTSTFAWYTSNTSVTVDNITGVTSTEADASSLYVSSALAYYEATATTPYEPTSWSDYKATATPHLVNTKTLISTTATENISDSDITGTILRPVYFDKVARTVKKISDGATATTPTYQDEDKNDYIEYVLRFRTANPGTATPIYIKKLTVANTVGTELTDLPTQYPLAEGGVSGINSKASPYAVDIRKALKMSVETMQVESDMTLSASASYATPKIYGFNSFATCGTSNVTVTSTNNAIGYYNTALGATLDRSTVTNYDAGTELATMTATTDTPLTLFTIPTTGYIQVKFRFYLDGWDEYCYDVCRQQGVTIGMKFTVSDSEATIMTTTTTDPAVTLAP